MKLILPLALSLVMGTLTMAADVPAENEADTEALRQIAAEKAKMAEEFKKLPKDKIRTTASGLQFIEVLEGKGKFPERGQKVVVNYTGWLEDGTKFDSSVDKGKPFEFNVGVGRVIQGWDEGVSGMRVGGKRRLIIPARLGYGSRGAGGVIPGNSTLIFDVELLDIKN